MRLASSSVTRVIRSLLSAIGLPRADDAADRPAPGINRVVDAVLDLTQTYDPQLAILAAPIRHLEYLIAEDLHCAAKIDAVLGKITCSLVLIPFESCGIRWRRPYKCQGNLRRLAEEAVDAVRAGGAFELVLAGEVVQMGKRLAERKGSLVLVELAAEHDRQQLGGAVRALAGGDDLGAALAVVRCQLIDPDMDTAERQIVRRQDERVGWQGATELVERIKVAGERVARGLVRRHADIGRDLRQDLVAGD